MKNLVLSSFMFIGLYMTSVAQVPANYNADNESFGMQPMLQYAFQQLGSKTVKGLEEVDIIGSRYLSETFVKTAIHSEGGLEGHTFSRYDGYNDEVQLKKSLNDNEVLVLLKRADIYAVSGGTTIVFKKFYDKKGKLERGHLFKLIETENLMLFERKIKRYKEGKQAVNSLQMSVKSRFIADSELYYLKKGEEKIRFLKTSKKEVLDLFKDEVEKADKVEEYISNNNIKIKDSSDILRIFNFSETL
ncbi:MAG: hypothetical protein WBB27_05930 [Maribacter sp.]